MIDRINLEDRAETMLAELAEHEWRTVADIDENAISDRVHEEADTACIYHHWCEQLIADYETHAAAPAESEYGTIELRADQWRDGMTRWAYEIASAVMHHAAHDALEDIKAAADELAGYLAETYGQSGDPDEIRMSLSCPHGWAAHDFELEDGTAVWNSRQLDGCNGAAREVRGVWLSFTWTPGEDEEAEA